MPRRGPAFQAKPVKEWAISDEDYKILRIEIKRLSDDLVDIIKMVEIVEMLSGPGTRVTKILEIIDRKHRLRDPKWKKPE